MCCASKVPTNLSYFLSIMYIGTRVSLLYFHCRLGAYQSWFGAKRTLPLKISFVRMCCASKIPRNWPNLVSIMDKGNQASLVVLSWPTCGCSLLVPAKRKCSRRKKNSKSCGNCCFFELPHVDSIASRMYGTWLGRQYRNKCFCLTIERVLDQTLIRSSYCCLHSA